MTFNWPAQTLLLKTFVVLFLYLFFPFSIIYAATFNIPPNDSNSLINAISAANLNEESDVINLANLSIYNLTEPINNSTYGLSGLPIISSEIIINGQGSTLSRDSTNNFRILSVSYQGNIILNNIIIQNGYATDSIGIYGGGGILNVGGTVSLNSSKIISNYGESNGGGAIWQGGTNSFLSIINSEIVNNNVGINGSGAGIHKRGPGITEIINSKILNNHAGHAGGAIYSGKFEDLNGGLINIKNSEINFNSARNYGGAIRNYSGTINILDSHILNNTLISTTNGGFLYIHGLSEGNATIHSSCISGNSDTALANNGVHIDAAQNWWGSADGPSGIGPGGGDSISGDVDYSGWLASCPPLASPSPSPSPSTIPSPSPSVTPSPSPSPSSLPNPIVLLPGLGGSWNTSALLTGGSGGTWKKTPFVKVYDNFKNTLLSAGYTENSDYFEFYYDWRKRVDNLAADFDNYLNTVVLPSQPAGTKVDLVGHSLGGLVARTYIQNYGTGKVDDLVTVGSPHEGAIPAYYAWAGAEMTDHSSLAQLGLDFYLYLHRKNFTSPVAALHNLSPGLQDILPTFDFAKNQQGTVITVGSMATVNQFLINLKNNLTESVTNLTSAIFGQNQETIEWLRLENRGLTDRLVDRWPDGRPQQTETTGQGDGTVLQKSATVGGAQNTAISAGHRDLIQSAPGIEAILAALEIDADAQTGNEQPPRNPGLFFLLHSPAQISVTPPGGGSSGQTFFSPEDKLLVIFGAAPGDYQVQVSGTGDGQYQLDIGQLTDTNEVWSSLVDEIQTGATDTWTISFNPSSPLPDPIIDLAGTGKISQAILRLEQLKTQTDDSRLKQYLDQIIKLLNKNKFNLNRLALASVYKFRFWVDRFGQSDAYLKAEADDIGRLLIQAVVAQGPAAQNLNQKQAKAELNFAEQAIKILEKRAGKISNSDPVLGNSLELIRYYFSRAQTGFAEENYWQVQANSLVVRVLFIEASALIH